MPSLLKAGYLPRLANLPLHNPQTAPQKTLLLQASSDSPLQDPRLLLSLAEQPSLLQEIHRLAHRLSTSESEDLAIRRVGVGRQGVVAVGRRVRNARASVPGEDLRFYVELLRGEGADDGEGEEYGGMVRAVPLYCQQQLILYLF